MRQIAIYGKGGVGKTTVACNLSVALSKRGLRVMQIGCDPKRDSVRNLMNGRFVPTILEVLAAKHARQIKELRLGDIINIGYNNILCVECGGPEPGKGCAGRGILLAITLLSEMLAFKKCNPDIIIYDILGDIVCGGFATPIREGYAEEVYLVCSGEFMSLYAANNICKGITRFAERGKSRLAGLIGNSKGNLEFEKALLTDFAARIGTELIFLIPLDINIQRCEAQGKTVIECAPNSMIAQTFQSLAERILANERRIVPKSLSLSELETLNRYHAHV